MYEKNYYTRKIFKTTVSRLLYTAD